MKFSVLTLFPEMFDVLNSSIIGRAKENGLIEIETINIRDFSKNKHKKVDDTPYGGGAGMVMMPDVVYDAYKAVETENAKVIYLSPQGKTLTQKEVKALSKEKHIILLCRTLWGNWPKSIRWNCRRRNFHWRLCFNRWRDT